MKSNVNGKKIPYKWLLRANTPIIFQQQYLNALFIVQRWGCGWILMFRLYVALWSVNDLLPRHRRKDESASTSFCSISSCNVNISITEKKYEILDSKEQEYRIQSAVFAFWWNRNILSLVGIQRLSVSPSLSVKDCMTEFLASVALNWSLK